MFLRKAFVYLLLLGSLCCLATDSRDSLIQCSSSKEKLLNFVLTTSQNDTGYWVAEIKLEHGQGTFGTDEPSEVQIEQNTHTCEGTSYVLISGKIIEPAAMFIPSAEGYKLVPGLGFYKLHLTPKSWHEAKKTCEAEGTHLAIPNSKDEAIEMMVIYSHHLDFNREDVWSDNVYIGVHDLDGEGEFKTIFDKPLNSTGWVRWSTNEPNNYDDEDCVTFKRNGRLNDVNCKKPLCFFCEKEW